MQECAGVPIKVDSMSMMIIENIASGDGTDLRPWGEKKVDWKLGGGVGIEHIWSDAVLNSG